MITRQEFNELLSNWGKDIHLDISICPNYLVAKNMHIKYIELHDDHSSYQGNYQEFSDCLKDGKQIVAIFADEWESRQKQCQGHLSSLLGIYQERIYARKCEIKEISKSLSKSFFETWHIQGGNKLSVISFGLFYDKKLVGAISLGRHSRQGNDCIVLDRLCFKAGVQIIGGASKLFTKCIEWAKNNNHNEIRSYSDNRWSAGGIYPILGFSLNNEYKPDYCYIDINEPFIRISKQSQQKKKTNCPEGMTELQWAEQRGMNRIWDYGKKQWIFHIKEKITEEKIQDKNDIKFFCYYCNKFHEEKKAVYDNAIKTSGSYTCDKQKSKQPDVAISEKFCNGCKQTHPIDKFGKDMSRSDGYANQCKACRTKSNLKRYYNAKELIS